VFSSMPLPSYTQPFDTIAIRPQKKPPQWETDPEPWSALRIFMAKVVCSKRFDILAGIITIANIVAMIYQADYEAQCFPGYASNISACPFTDDPTLHAINLVFLIWYSLEVSVRIFAERLKYFKRPMNQIDILSRSLGGLPKLLVPPLTSTLYALSEFYDLPEHFVWPFNSVSFTSWLTAWWPL